MRFVLKKITDCPLKLDEVKYLKGGIELSNIELQKLISFWLSLQYGAQKKKLFFRGDNYARIAKNLNLTPDAPREKLNFYLFQIGDKGRAYREEYKNQIKQKSKKYPIDDVSPLLLGRIFNKLHEALSKPNTKEFAIFSEKNSRFKKYFFSKENKEHFIQAIENVTPIQQRIIVRDFYLKILHQKGGGGFYNNSFYQSVTTDLKQALRFTGGSTSDKFVYVGWLGDSKLHIPNSSKNLNLSSYGLPEYVSSPYPFQKEITLKGGILPHFLLGYFRCNCNYKNLVFEVNPHLFSTSRNLHEITKEGFEIDQSDFSDALAETGYDGFFFLPENGELTDFN